jgi:hypothetical protein
MSRLKVLEGSANTATGTERFSVDGPSSLDLSSGVTSSLRSSKPDAFDKWVQGRRKIIMKERR